MLVNMSALHPSEVIKLLKVWMACATVVMVESLLNHPKAHNNDVNAAAVAFLDNPNQYPPYPVSTSQLLSLDQFAGKN